MPWNDFLSRFRPRTAAGRTGYTPAAPSRPTTRTTSATPAAATTGPGALARANATAAESPSSPTVRYPDYARLFEGGVLPITLGVGFDEGGWDQTARSQIVSGLKSRGFEKVDLRRFTDAELRGKKLDPAMIDRKGEYWMKTFSHDGKDVQALLKLVTRDSEKPVERFQEGFTRRGLIIYGGHARYGSGPDFDHKESPEGNLHISTAADSHMREILKGKPNALRELKLTDDYQLMIFAGCTTNRYIDDLNTLPKNKNDGNLDVVGSDDELLWSDISDYVLKSIDVVMEGESADKLNEELVKISGGITFTFDGFDDNPTQGAMHS